MLKIKWNDDNLMSSTAKENQRKGNKLYLIKCQSGAVGSISSQRLSSFDVQMIIEFLWIIVELSTSACEFKENHSQEKTDSIEIASIIVLYGQLYH